VFCATLCLTRIGFYTKIKGKPEANAIMARTENRLKSEVADALKGGTLPAWFKSQVGGMGVLQGLATEPETLCQRVILYTCALILTPPLCLEAHLLITTRPPCFACPHQVKAQVASDDFRSGEPEIEGMGRENVYLQELVRRDFQGIPWG
jgi:hypothetical protein